MVCVAGGASDGEGGREGGGDGGGEGGGGGSLAMCFLSRRREGCVAVCVAVCDVGWLAGGDVDRRACWLAGLREGAWLDVGGTVGWLEGFALGAEGLGLGAGGLGLGAGGLGLGAGGLGLGLGFGAGSLAVDGGAGRLDDGDMWAEGLGMGWCVGGGAEGADLISRQLRARTGILDVLIVLGAVVGCAAGALDERLLAEAVDAPEPWEADCQCR